MGQPCVSSDLTYTIRNGFRYNKTFQSADRQRKFDIENQTLMLNIYFQANSQKNGSIFNKLHPFVGAGIGIAWNKTRNFKAIQLSTGIEQASPQSGNVKRNFAWQAMLGVGYNITQHLIADIGYRYVNVGKISTGALTIPGSAIPADPLSAKHSDLQEAFLSLKYVI